MAPNPRGADSLVRWALFGAALYSVLLCFPELGLGAELLVLLVFLAGLATAVLHALSTGRSPGIGFGPALGITLAAFGALLQTLFSVALLMHHRNPIGAKLVTIWSWVLDQPRWAPPGALGSMLRDNLGWLALLRLDPSVLSCIAVYSFLACVLPASLGAALGGLLMHGHAPPPAWRTPGVPEADPVPKR